MPVRGQIFDRNGVLLAYSKPTSVGTGYRRVYTDPSLAGLIGYYIGPQYDSTGIEHQYDDYLSGRKTTSQTCPTNGNDIYLTIDERIQRIVEQYARIDPSQFPPDNVNGFATNRSSIILTDPHTGELLAMLSTPTYDPNRIAGGDLNYLHQLQNDPEQPLLERPLQARYVPGSVYKTLTLMAAIDSGNSQLTDQFDQQHALGPVTIGGEVFGPNGNNIQAYTHNYPVSLEYGLVHSDNVIFAQVGAKMGANTWLDYNSRFYVGQQPPFDLPVTASSVTPQGQNTLTDAQLAENSFGQGVDFVTPFQMSLFNDAIANDGHLMRPALVLKIVGPDKAVIQSFSQQDLGAKIKVDTAKQLRDAMYGVVRCSSGFLVQRLLNSPWAIAGKTGTGEVGGGQPAEGWLITQAPYNPNAAPALTIVAMRENGGEGIYLNGPITADIYNAIFTNQSILSADSIHVPSPDVAAPDYCSTTGLLQD